VWEGLAPNRRGSGLPLGQPESPGRAGLACALAPGPGSCPPVFPAGRTLTDGSAFSAHYPVLITARGFRAVTWPSAFGGSPALRFRGRALPHRRGLPRRRRSLPFRRAGVAGTEPAWWAWPVALAFLDFRHPSGFLRKAWAIPCAIAATFPPTFLPRYRDGQPATCREPASPVRGPGVFGWGSAAHTHQLMGRPTGRSFRRYVRGRPPLLPIRAAGLEERFGVSRLARCPWLGPAFGTALGTKPVENPGAGPAAAVRGLPRLHGASEKNRHEV